MIAISSDHDRGTTKRRAPLTVCNRDSSVFCPTAEDRDADREIVHAPHSRSSTPALAGREESPKRLMRRWVCEQAHQQLKEELGLDHFEGRSWTGLHRHALMTMIAYAFLQSRRLKAAGRKKRIAGPAPQPSMPAIGQAILDLFARPPPGAMPHCEKRLIDPGKTKLPK